MSEKRFNIATFPVLKRQGKTFTSMTEWENLVCRDCGEKMVLEKENDYESVKFCHNCGRRDLLIKKLKCEEMIRMSEKRFVVETVEITDCDTDVSRIAKVITDTKETYSYEELYEVAELLNRLSEENEQLRQKLDFYLLDEFEWKEKYGD